MKPVPLVKPRLQLSPQNSETNSKKTTRAPTDRKEKRKFLPENRFAIRILSVTFVTLPLSEKTPYKVTSGSMSNSNSNSNKFYQAGKNFYSQGRFFNVKLPIFAAIFLFYPFKNWTQIWPGFKCVQDLDVQCSDVDCRALA
jgi:hypothetical protein